MRMSSEMSTGQDRSRFPTAALSLATGLCVVLLASFPVGAVSNGPILDQMCASGPDTSAQTSSQTFRPLLKRLDRVEINIVKAGGTAPFTVNLVDNANNLLFSWPSMAPTQSGWIAFVGANQQVTPGSTYKIQFVTGTAYRWTTCSSAYSGGEGFYGTVPCGCDFMFRTYAPQDSTAPTTPGVPSTSSPTSNNEPTWTWMESTDDTSPTVQYQMCWDTVSGGCSNDSGWMSATRFTAPAALADGTWFAFVKAADPWDNVSESAVGSVLIDRSSPHSSFTTQSPSVLVRQAGLAPMVKDSVTGTVQDMFSPVSSVTVHFVPVATGAGTDTYVAATLSNCTNGGKSCDWSALAPTSSGTYEVFVQSSDSLGNTEAPVGPILVIAV
jgi:hypothetical protein